LREVVRRLQFFTQTPFHLVVCDNGSSPDVLAYLCEAYAEYDNVTVMFNRENAYVGPGTNICMQYGASDYAIYVCGKEGFVVDHGWEKNLIDYMDGHPDVGLAGTLCHSPTYLTGAEYPKGIQLFPRFRNKAFAEENPDRRFGHVQGGFFVLRRAMFDAIGGFSEEVPHSYTDVEYSFYAESMGWKLGTPPRLLALFNKTRPGLFSRVDESVAAMHPPSLDDLPLLDLIAKRRVAYCNVCGWNGEAFEQRDGVACCVRCGSRPADRSLYRYLAESMLTYRRLPALGIGVGPAMEGIWRQQFQGKLHSASGLQDLLKRGPLDFRPGALKLIYFDGLPADWGGEAPVLREVDRLLADDGVLLLRMAGDLRALPDKAAEACGLRTVESVRYASGVVRYDSQPLFVGRRAETERCVS
jgi:glycosyltransferase involved in cell wall biosynthesis